MRVATNICAVIALACVGFAVGDWANHPNAIGLLGILVVIAVFGFLLSFLYRPRTAAADGVPAGFEAPPAREDPAININRAGVNELSALPGVGPTAAQRIVDERDAHGNFATVADLARVPGFSPEKVRSLSDRARV